jgi:YD repeat-containing protein
VSVTLNEDGSRTVYEFDPINHKATSTTTGRDGKPQGKIRYELDEAGRFGKGRIFGPDGQFLFRTVYKYDGAGRLQEEARFGKDDRPTARLVYSYDAAGKQTGYAVYDGSGKLLGQTSSPAPSKTRKAR